MYTLNLKEGQTSTVKLANGIRLTLTGGKDYKQSLLKQLHDEKHPIVTKEEIKPKKEKE